MKLVILAAGCLLHCADAYPWHHNNMVAQVKRSYGDWNKADNSQDIAGMTSQCTDDCVFFPPNGPAIRGRKAVVKFYKHLLKAGKWPRWKTLTFKRIVENTADVVIAEHTARMRTYDGKMWIGSGVWIFRVINNAIKLRAVIWNSDVPVPEKKSRGVPVSRVRYTIPAVPWKMPHRMHPNRKW